jgi:hypothetical protein
VKRSVTNFRLTDWLGTFSTILRVISHPRRLEINTMSKLQPHQQRVVDEKTELDKKASALSDFIGTNPIFDTLDTAEQERLREQNDVMWQYSEILGARISAFSA